MRKLITRAIAVATAASMAATAFGIQSAAAAPASRAEAAPYATGDVEVGSQRRRVRRGGPGLGTFLAIAGTVAAIAAANSRRHYYYESYPAYGYGPYYDPYAYSYYDDGYYNYAPAYVAPRVYAPRVYAPAHRLAAPRLFVPRHTGGGRAYVGHRGRHR